MKLFLIALFLGMFIGYAIKDLLSPESKLVYHIKRLKLKKSPGGSINVSVDAEVPEIKRKHTSGGMFKGRKQRKKQRLEDKLNNLHTN